MEKVHSTPRDSLFGSSPNVHGGALETTHAEWNYAIMHPTGKTLLRGRFPALSRVLSGWSEGGFSTRWCCVILSGGFGGEGFSIVTAKIRAVTSASVRMRGRGLETRRWKVRGKPLPLVRG